MHRSVKELEAAINAFLDRHNADPKPFRWIKSVDDILAAAERLHIQHFIDTIRRIYGSGYWSTGRNCVADAT